MAGGQRQRIEISNLLASIDHELIHPVLKEAGLHVQFLSHPPFHGDPPLTSLALKVPRDMAQIRSVAIYEGSDDISHGNGGPGEDTWEIFLKHSLTAAMVLKLEIVDGQKVITVPLELNDVRLP
jgi:hypothetical protein